MYISGIVSLAIMFISMNSIAGEVNSKSSDEVQVCFDQRFEKNLKKIDVKKSSVKLVKYEDHCDSKNFCFTFRLLNQAKVATFNIPEGSEIRYCEREGIRGVIANDGKVLNSPKLACRSGMYFWGNPSELCYCEVEGVFPIRVKKLNQSKNLELPTKSSLYFKDGKVTHFISASNLSFENTKIIAGSPYSVKDQKDNWFSLTNLAVSEIPQCRNNSRDPDENHLYDVLEKYNIRRTDIAELSFSSSCDGDIPREEDFTYSAIRGRLTETLSTKEIFAPKDSYVSFCNGHLSSIATSEKEVKFWSHRCKGKVEANWDVGNSNDKEKYGCILNKPETLNGHELPAGVKIFFNRDRIICFGIDREQQEAATVLGVSLRSGTFVIKDGKVVQDDSCKD